MRNPAPVGRQGWGGKVRIIRGMEWYKSLDVASPSCWRDAELVE
jgi:hypothetical protein